MENTENNSTGKKDFRKPLLIFEAIKNIPAKEASENIETSSKENEKKSKERTIKDFLFPTWMLF